MMWNMKLMIILIVVGALRMAPQNLRKETGGTGGQRKNQDHLDHSTVKIT